MCESVDEIRENGYPVKATQQYVAVEETALSFNPLTPKSDQCFYFSSQEHCSIKHAGWEKQRKWSKSEKPF